MASPITEVSMRCTIMTFLLLLLLLLFSSTRGQQLQQDGNTLLMMNVIDILDTLSLQLKEQERTLETKMEALLEAHEIKIEAKLEEQKRTLKAKMEVLLEGLQQCSTRDQISEFQNLLATDECEKGHHNCSELATCTDSFNHYKCACLPGYSGDGFTCEDVNECSEKKEICRADQICQNNPGSYTCVCPEGFKEEGDICQDVDECSETKEVCSADLICQNNPGSYTCVCPEGFVKEGDICQDVDECSEEKYVCRDDQICQNNPGSYTCICPERFMKIEGSICQFCEFPSLWIPSLGCLTVVMSRMTWNNAKSTCQEMRMRLAEGIRREHIDSIVQHFHDGLSVKWIWVGIRNGRWLSSEEGEKVSHEVWSRGQPGGGIGNCGMLDVNPPTTGLEDLGCTGTYSALCQSLP